VTSVKIFLFYIVPGGRCEETEAVDESKGRVEGGCVEEE
jgi:hypothetical protein